jgi:hypothetical protein
MSDLVRVRKYVSIFEETHHDGGGVLARPVVKAAVGAVIANPYAGRYVTDIQPMMKALEPLAVDLTERVIKALGTTGAALEAYGKGVIVGLDGELEHAALWHQPSGFGIRHAMPKPDELVFIVAASIGGRPHARVGGLTEADIKVGDGQR